MKHILFLFLLFILSKGNFQAQLTGTYNIPGDYASIGGAISALNISGVTGPVTINIAAGHTETVIPGGYTLQTIVGASASNSIVFQKSGIGLNPVVFSYTNGVGTPTTSNQDGIWRLSGVSYVTIDGVDLADVNTTNPKTMEFGFCFFKNSSFSPPVGCQNNTIRNCVITLNRINNATGAGICGDGSRGIEMINASVFNHTSYVGVGSPGSTHSNNKFHSNIIQNCNTGIVLSGFIAASPYTNGDTYNDIGGTSAVTGNTIINYGGGGTLSPAVGIEVSEQYEINIGNNVINNNTGAGINHATTLKGIYLKGASGANVMVQSNTLSISNTGSLTSGMAIIENNSGAGGLTNTVSILNNVLSACTITLANPSFTFNGIVNSATARNLVISGNTFTNNRITSTFQQVNLIYNSVPVPGVITINNNNLSHSLTSNGVLQGSLWGIYTPTFALSSSITVNNNNFSDFVSASPNGTVHFTFISTAFTGSLSSAVISGNTWSNLTLNTAGSIQLIITGREENLLTVSNNSIVGSLTRTGYTGEFRMIQFNQPKASCKVTISGNNFSNITSASPGSGYFYGIFTFPGLNGPFAKMMVHDNVISNINYNTDEDAYCIYVDDPGDAAGTSGSEFFRNRISSVTTAGQLNGIYIIAGSWLYTMYTEYPLAVYQNTVNDISGSKNNAPVCGLFVDMGFRKMGTSVYNNKVYNIISTHNVGFAKGIYCSSAPAFKVYNNIVGGISAPNSSRNDAVTGLHTSGSADVFNNTVFLSASGPAGMYSSAFQSAGVPKLRNNIFVNLSTASGAAVATVLRNGTALYGYDSTSNNNLFYAGTPGPNRQIYFIYGTGGHQTLATYKTFRNGADAGSFTENPAFTATLGAAPDFLNIVANTTTQIESGGVMIAGLTDDYPRTPRNSPPDVGAWEGNYVSLGDLQCPNINSSGFTTPNCNTSTRTYTALLADASGIATGSLAPRVYYKLNATGTYSSVPGTLSSGTPTLGTWDFTLSYSASLGDTVFYYLVAQDNILVPNLFSTQPIGFAATNVNTVLSPPVLPSSYVIGMILNGIYEVGSGGTFTTLTRAAMVYNMGCLTGPVTFSLTDATYSSGEIFPITFQDNPTASATNSLLIRPAGGLTVTIQTPSPHSKALIKMKSARYITIDGINASGTALNLVFANQNLDFANIWLTSVPLTGPGCNNIGIINLSLSKTGVQGTGFKIGILATVEDNAVMMTGGLNHDNIAIKGNSFFALDHSIIGVGYTSSGSLDNWVVSGNVTNTGGSVLLSHANNCTVTSNLFQGVGASSGIIAAVNLRDHVSGFSVTQNTLNAGGGSAFYSAIYMGNTVSNGTVAFNILNCVSTASANNKGRGIYINTELAASNIRIYNNMVTANTGLVSSGYQRTCGIGIEQSGGINIEHNSVHIFSGKAPAFYVGSGCSNLTVKNNLFANTKGTLPLSDTCVPIYCLSPANAFSSLDYNNYSVSGNSVTALGFRNGFLASLPALKSSFGQNANSIATQAVFNSQTDLHLDPNAQANSLLDNLGIPVSGISTDVDAQSRNLTTPDIGADEFTVVAVCNLVDPALIIDSVITVCNTQTTAILANTVSAGLGIQYEWQRSTSNGGPYSPVSGGTGSNTTIYVPTIATGTFYYVLKTTCPASTLTTISNEVTLTVKTAPNPVIVASSTVLCGATTLTLTASGASAYSWGSSSLVITPTASGIYYVTGSNPPCPTVQSNTINVYVSTVPTVAINSLTNAICPGNTGTLVASGAPNFSWSTGASGATLNPSPTVTSTYTVIGYKASGCANTKTVNITVHPNPTLGITGNTSICSGESTTLTANGAVTYSWNTSDLTPTVSLGPVSTTTFTVYGYNAFGCMDSETVAVISNSLPVITVVQSAASVCVGSPASFTATGASTYTWNSSNNAVTTITPANAATYTITGTGANGCISSQTFALGTYSLPVLTISPSSTTLCAFSQVSFTASGASSYTWNGSSVSPTFAANPSVNTAYFVEGAESLNNCRSTQTIFVTVNPLPPVNIVPGNLTVCAGSSATLTANGASTYTWQSPVSYNAQIIVTPSSNTIYTVSGASSFGCVSTKTVSITSVSVPVIQVNPAQQTICSNTSATITASGANTYTWQNIGQAGATVTLNAFTNTIYTVTGANTSGCTTMKSFTVNVNPSPTLQVSPLQVTMCIGENITFTASGAQSYTWLPDNSTSPAFQVIALNNSQYTVTGSNGNGCTDEAKVILNVDACLSLAKNNAIRPVEVFPNPTNGLIYVAFNFTGVKIVSLINCLGQVLETRVTENVAESLDLSTLSKGVYYLKVVSGVGFKTFRVILN